MSEEGQIPLPGSLQEIVGALLFASETPLTAADLKAAVRAVEPEQGENDEIMDVYRTCTAREIDQALKGLGKALDVAGAGFSLVCTGGAYRLQSVPSCGRYVRAMLKLDRPSRLGRASLETLAIIAYRQPITKSEIEEIRGVDVSGNMKTLMDLQLVRLVGKSELPGHPFLYGTTPLFLDHFGLASLQQLNELDPTLQRSNPREKAASYKKPVAQQSLPLEGLEKEENIIIDEGSSPEADEEDEIAKGITGTEGAEGDEAAEGDDAAEGAEGDEGETDSGFVVLAGDDEDLNEDEDFDEDEDGEEDEEEDEDEDEDEDEEEDEEEEDIEEEDTEDEEEDYEDEEE